MFGGGRRALGLLNVSQEGASFLNVFGLSLSNLMFALSQSLEGVVLAGADFSLEIGISSGSNSPTTWRFALPSKGR